MARAASDRQIGGSEVKLPKDRVGLFGIDEFAAYCGVDYTTIQKWINKLQFPAFRLPHGVYYTTRDAITAWIFAAAEANREWKEERRAQGKRADNKIYFPGRNLRNSLAVREAGLPTLEEIYAAEDARRARKAASEEEDGR